MIKLPKHNCELLITHNPHKGNYETVEELIFNRDLTDDYFVSKEEMDLCIKHNELWEVQWYPDTPVGFHLICGYTLESVLNKANELDDE